MTADTSNLVIFTVSKGYRYHSVVDLLATQECRVCLVCW